jgi:plasmid stabilization system protein ParE
MNEHGVIFTPEAQAQLHELYDYIADRSSAHTALRYTTAIVDYCSAMKNFPHRGASRDDIRQGLRVTHYKGKAVIAFAVDDAAMTGIIVGVFYGGRNYAAILSGEQA